MIAYEDALALVLGTLSALGTEEVPVAQAAGRVPARDVVSRVDSPPFNKAAMDGFAVRSRDVAELPATLALVGDSFAGGWPEFRVGPGQAARITTGSPVPEGADTVVMVEHTEELEGGRVRVLKLSGSNICPRGEDMRRGETVARAGEFLSPLGVGVAASAGHERLAVFRRPRVALLCTGTEVVEPGRPVARGQIYNSNGPMLSALLGPLAEEFRYLGVVGDEPGRLREAIRRGLQADLFVISGGVSVGQRDLVPPTLEELGVRRVFHRCAIKPGKPTYFGVRDGAAAFGMPGNPLSCFVVFQVLVRPAIRRLMGLRCAEPAFRDGVMDESFGNKPGRRNFLPCTVRAREGVCHLRRTRSHGSADITGARSADALLSLPADCSGVEKGETVRFLWSGPHFPPFSPGG